ncbi:MAG: FAD:protein FMN transferase [Gammaproteobacteria bacterium]|nr:FAD:protein FMN transferase [Gammaproteobacteria bacterium]MBT5154001.1 FAD:protein FMN transferase [Gammaproteobacteria bacterium]MBT5723257.1 FAD:protein FMN transferase [Gammaproteobacteria bacterium]MBT6892051.1 FAD:protein FMN transferase [Gammaproteobacteria bacterium]
METYQFDFQAMGCPCELRLAAVDRSLANEVARICTSETQRFESKYSRYRTDSVTSQVNNASGRHPVTIDPEVAAILDYSGVCYVQSNGLFDITSGVLRQLWNKNMRRLPTDSELDFYLEKVGWKKIEMSSNEVFLPIKGMQLDFGGVVKEYVADVLAAKARSMGIEHGLINLGGDICIIGSQPDGTPWSIGVTHPTESNCAIAVIELSEGAVTTSGGYERYFDIDGVRYSHLINPETGWPVEGLLSASVAAPTSIVAGSLTSIALLKTPEDGIRFLEECATPYFAVDQQLGCHGNLGDIRYA